MEGCILTADTFKALLCKAGVTGTGEDGVLTRKAASQTFTLFIGAMLNLCEFDEVLAWFRRTFSPLMLVARDAYLQ